jgi:hypothetical protein
MTVLRLRPGLQFSNISRCRRVAETHTRMYGGGARPKLAPPTCDRRSWTARGIGASLCGDEERFLCLSRRGLPESFDVQPKSAPHEWEFQAIVAFGPPGEYGEETIEVEFP